MTDNRIATYRWDLCSTCGAVVGNWTDHQNWHHELDYNLATTRMMRAMEHALELADQETPASDA